MNKSENLAFEYVVGTLRGRERERFRKKILTDTLQAKEVLYWEESFVDLHALHIPLKAGERTWEGIESRINNVAQQKHDDLLWPFLTSLLGSSIIAFTSCCLLLLLFWPNEKVSPAYIAVLMNSSGQAQVTALTDDSGETLSLNWQEPLELKENQDIQLWAQSKRDGEIRSLLILGEGNKRYVSLSEAQWRLVKDANYLLLTLEEEGGSAIDEPSDILLAKGLCVRLKSSNEKKSS